MIALLSAYRAERFRLRMAVGVPALLAIAGQAGRPHRAGSFGADAALAFLLFAQFRILDDLADRDRDARRHPERALVRAAALWPVRAVGMVLAASALVVCIVRDASGTTAGAYALLVAGLLIFYAVRGDRTLVGDHLLLAKYPALVWIVASADREAAAPAPLALALLATYLGACLYEALHDQRSPIAARPGLVAGEGLLLVLTLAALSLRGMA